MITRQMLENANKVVYLAEQYPEHNLTQLISLLQLPAIDINNAVWAAIDMGWLTEPDKKTKRVEVLQRPEPYYFGESVDDLQDILLYAFERLGKQETDLEEYSLSQWVQGYPSHDVLIAMRLLLDGKKLHEYMIEDGENNYTFYTLYENKDKVWGSKQFKQNPLNRNKPGKRK